MMKIWGEVETEKSLKMKVSGIEFNARKFKGKGKGSKRIIEGYGIPLSENGELFTKFSELVKSLSDKRNSFELKNNITAFSTFCESDRGLDIFPIIGFYVMDNFLIFSEEIDTESPRKKLGKFIRYYKKKFNIP